MKIIFSVFFAAAFLFSSAFAQTNPVQITSGKLDFDTFNSLYAGGTAVMQSNDFTSIARLDSTQSPWMDVCSFLDCKMGLTFSLPPGLAIGDRGHRLGSFIINGTYYQNVYYSGYFQLSRTSFLIPRIARKKGNYFFRDSFKLDGNLYVCRISDSGNGCPAGDILYNRAITGHGDVNVTLQIKTTFYNDRFVTYLTPKRIVYEFKP